LPSVIIEAQAIKLACAVASWGKGGCKMMHGEREDDYLGYDEGADEAVGDLVGARAQPDVWGLADDCDKDEGVDMGA